MSKPRRPYNQRLPSLCPPVALLGEVCVVVVGLIFCWGGRLGAGAGTVTMEVVVVVAVVGSVARGDSDVGGELVVGPLEVVVLGTTVM
jgi:hypothetical protein